jgi:hypothetical protein
MLRSPDDSVGAFDYPRDDSATTDYYNFVIFDSSKCYSRAAVLAQLILARGFTCENEHFFIFALLRSTKFRVI